MSHETHADKLPNYDIHPHSEQELADYIHGLVTSAHDYDTSGYAMAACAIAAYNFIGYALGTTGFQASYAAMAFLAQAQGYEHGFIILNGEELLYPQYDLLAKAAEWLQKTRRELGPEARKRIAENGLLAHPDVLARWQEIAGLDQEVPA